MTKSELQKFLTKSDKCYISLHSLSPPVRVANAIQGCDLMMAFISFLLPQHSYLLYYRYRKLHLHLVHLVSV